MVQLKQQVGLTVVPEVELWPKKQPTPSTAWQLENQSLKTLHLKMYCLLYERKQLWEQTPLNPMLRAVNSIHICTTIPLQV